MPTRRWEEQRWILDNIIRTVGVDWDQGRTGYLMAPCGVDAFPDFQGIRTRVQKFADIEREFTRAAERRERLALSAEREERHVSAREHWFVASILYGGAQWPIFENNQANRRLGAKKTECYGKYCEHADHEIRRVEIPFGDQSLPAYLHLPRGYAGGRQPAVLAIDGMDGFKEMMVSLYGDRLLERGFPILALDGPGQGECTVRGIHVGADNFAVAGRSALEWMRRQPEIDPVRIAILGISFGSFWAMQVAAADSRLIGCAVAFVCHEPGCRTIFESASPTFKARFMYMAGYDDEAEFDRFAESLTLRGIGPGIRCPVLSIAGEEDELSPIQHTIDLLAELTVPKELVIYQGERHGLNSTGASFLGPSWGDWTANWLEDRLRGKRSADSRRCFVDMAGQVHLSEWPA